MLRVVRNLGIIVGTAIASIAILYFSIPTGNTAQNRFDVIVVLGSPTNSDGSLSPVERESVLEAVREYRSGISSSLLMTGGAAHNSFVESRAMAGFARSEGIPASAIFTDAQARNTVENAYFAFGILQAHQWQSALIIGMPSHVRRASLIFRYYPIDWRVRPAPWPSEWGVWPRLRSWTEEILYTTYVRIFGFSKSQQYLPHTHFTPAQL
ncbi:MAG TPA: YdcF family protein [Acidobacteriaceae bacterium]|jgi:uncharacterized SAM-binding protein YcdF (DUF218 family)